MVGRLVVDAAIRAATLSRMLSLRAPRASHRLVDYYSPLVNRGLKRRAHHTLFCHIRVSFHDMEDPAGSFPKSLETGD